MIIDESREKMDMSDHCMITIEVKIRKRDNQWKEWKERYYYSIIVQKEKTWKNTEEKLKRVSWYWKTNQ